MPFAEYAARDPMPMPAPIPSNQRKTGAGAARPARLSGGDLAPRILPSAFSSGVHLWSV
jgi:hypothetical protein